MELVGRMRILEGDGMNDEMIGRYLGYRSWRTSSIDYENREVIKKEMSRVNWITEAKIIKRTVKPVLTLQSYNTSYAVNEFAFSCSLSLGHPTSDLSKLTY